jgi:hypothetical protein
VASFPEDSILTKKKIEAQTDFSRNAEEFISVGTVPVRCPCAVPAFPAGVAQDDGRNLVHFPAELGLTPSK